jgi:uncharacterized membrane protein
MRVMMRRGNRVSDTAVVGVLERNGAFFASSCLLILAGILTAMGYTNEVMEIFASMPFGSAPSGWAWELRMVVMMVLFVYAFFKFTWSMRLYNFVGVMIGSAPLPEDTKVSAGAREALAVHSAEICNQAGDAFNLGLRSYYYALAVIAWLVHPAMLIVSATLVVYVLYRREFKSSALKSLQAGKVFD